MFRPNRIGTPVIHDTGAGGSAAVWVPATAAFSSGNFSQVNVITAAPVLEFGRTSFGWFGAAPVAIPAGHFFSLVQQFTVTKPLKGNISGVEINAAIVAALPASAAIVPVLVKCAATGTLGNSGVTGHPTYHSEPPEHVLTDDTICVRTRTYRTQFILSDATDPSGVYGHGFTIFDNSGAGYNFQYFIMQASVRQLNDQQTKGYRDTRK